MLQSSKLVLQAMQKPNILQQQQESSKNIGENYRRNKYKDASDIDHLQTGTFLYTYIYTLESDLKLIVLVING